ncbi:MAG: SUMF1/EgtB/PvdO family nonheme iron enzyme [Candidatus Eisenbacteria bacterium]
MAGTFISPAVDARSAVDGFRPDRDARRALADRLAAARQRTDDFFALLTPAARYERAIAKRHRIVFYRGHLEAFDWNLLARTGERVPAFDSGLDRLFAFGIDPVDGDLPRDAPADWPTLVEVEAYVARVRAELDALLDREPLDDREASAWEMTIEHRLMHAETLAYMLPHLPLDAFAPGAARAPGAQETGPGALPRGEAHARTGAPGAARRVTVPTGCVTLGRSKIGGRGFGWDNEFDDDVAIVPRFTIDARNVTNGEFRNFVEAGGYDEPLRHLWRADDWAWRVAENLTHPVLWQSDPAGPGWRQRFAFVEGPLDPDLPVQVSLAEARAYAAWRGRRLPTEAEFHRAAFGTPSGTERPYPWGVEAPVGGVHGAFDFVRVDPAPVGSYPAGDSAFGVADLLGNGWEWTDTVFAPFAGFAADPRYAGYSEPFFDGKHFVIKGGSTQTDRALLRRSFRNWFQPHYPYVFAAFRCVDATPVPQE